MTKYINAGWLYGTLCNLWDKTDSEDFEKGVFETIINAPTADVAEVVYCKDCKHKGGNGYDEDVCWKIEPQHGVYVSDNWYCADGERRE